MRKLTIVLFVIACLLPEWSSYGQQKAEKKSSSSYSKLRSSSEQASDLLDEAKELKSKNLPEALNKVQDALALSIARNDEFTEAKCYLLLGEINEGIQEWKLAKENYTRANEILSTSFAASSEYKKALKGLGDTNLRLMLYNEALQSYRELLTLRNSDAEKAECLLDISEVYYQMGNYDEALKTLEGISLNPKNRTSSLDTRLQNQKAKILARQNNLESSKTLYQNSLNSASGNAVPDPLEKQSVQQTKEEISDVLRSQKKYDDEISLRNQSIEYNMNKSDFSEVAKDKVEISKTLEAKGENTAALKTLEEAAGIADTLRNPKEQATAFLALANQYEKNGRNKDAILAYKKYSTAVEKTEKENENRLAEKAEILRKQKDIEEISKDVSIGQREETIAQGLVYRQQIIIYGLVAIILIIAVTSYFIYKSAQDSKLANQMLALKSLRSQMNPHFIFNALNSVNHFIAQQDERTANKFLSEFSQLMRLVLENSQEDFIPLLREQEILSLYLKLEHYRFRDKFDYNIEIDQRINSEAIAVPPMLIQPYIENAVWHGLRYKEEKGKLLLQFKQESDNLIVEITDDGIGRKKSVELKTKNQKKHISTGLKNIQERLAIINKVYKANYRVVIDDLLPGAGTHVKIYLPLTQGGNGL